jgi:hypothetical protein
VELKIRGPAHTVASSDRRQGVIVTFRGREEMPVEAWIGGPLARFQAPAGVQLRLAAIANSPWHATTSPQLVSKAPRFLSFTHDFTDVFIECIYLQDLAWLCLPGGKARRYMAPSLGRQDHASMCCVYLVVAGLV